MSTERVQVVGHSQQAAQSVWQIIRDFGSAWHPVIDTIKVVRENRGSLVREFSVKGEGTLYREQLTYFSDTERALSYTHLSGIKDVDSYKASLKITDDGNGGSKIIWTANIEASAHRAGEIAAGTQSIFEAGINALDSHTGIGPSIEITSRNPSLVSITPLVIENRPRLAVSVTPDREGPLCLFLHGIGGARGNWNRQLELSGSTMRSASLDLRGYGDSHPGSEQSTIEDYCADILAVCNTLGAEKIVLCGLSYGSWIATSFAMRYRSMLAGLVLSGGCTGMSEASESERESFRRSREFPLNAGQSPADFAPTIIEAITGPHANAEVRQQLLESMADISVSTYRDALTCFSQPQEQFDFSLLQIPVLMMTGEHDQLAKPIEIRSIARRIVDSVPLADVQFEVVDGAGHVCNLEQPDIFNRYLHRFLVRLQS